MLTLSSTSGLLVPFPPAARAAFSFLNGCLDVPVVGDGYCSRLMRNEPTVGLTNASEGMSIGHRSIKPPLSSSEIRPKEASSAKQLARTLCRNATLRFDGS